MRFSITIFRPKRIQENILCPHKIQLHKEMTQRSARVDSEQYVELAAVSHFIGGSVLS